MSLFANKQVQVNPPATVEQIAAVSTVFGGSIPDELITLWQESNGISFPETGVVLYSTEDIKERNDTYEISDYTPELLLIGDDSGGSGFLIHKSKMGGKPLKIDLGAIGSSDGEIMDSSLLSWVAAGCPIINQKSLDIISGNNERVDIILKSQPIGGIKEMLLIKKELSLSLNSNQLQAAMHKTPVVLLENVYYSKYKNAYEKINKKLSCLSMVIHNP